MALTIKSIRSEMKSDLDYARRQFADRKANMRNISMDMAIVKAVIGRRALPNISTYSYLSGDNLHVTASIRVSSFKHDAYLNAVLERAVDADLEAKESNDYVTEYVVERDFRFRLPNGGHFTVEARLNEDESTSCRKVQVGTKLQEVPVFEIACD